MLHASVLPTTSYCDLALIGYYYAWNLISIDLQYTLLTDFKLLYDT